MFRRLFFSALMAAAVLPACAQQADGSLPTRIIAHRGFWNTPGSAQNGITALLKADSIGVYGSEFDVWLTKDNQLVLNHDNKLDGRSVEDYTLDELKQRRLENGEQMPTLEEFLTTAKAKTRVKLILELKPHCNAQRDARAAKAVVDMVHRMGLDERVEYISFSLHAVKEFVRLAPRGTKVFYLNGELSPEELKALGCAGPDYHMKVYRRNPDWSAQCRRLGLETNVWTVNRTEDRAYFIGRTDYLTTDHPVEALQEAASLHSPASAY